MSQNEHNDDQAIPELPEELTLFAKQLAQFQPAEQPAAREQFLFKAGQDAVRAELSAAIRRYQRTTHVWQAAASVLLMVTTGMGVTLATRSETQAPSRAVAVKETTPVVIERQEHPAMIAHIVDQPHDAAPISLDRLRERQTLIAQSDDGWAENSSRSSSSQPDKVLPTLVQPTNLDSGSLLRGLPAQIFIRRLTEESTL